MSDSQRISGNCALGTLEGAHRRLWCCGKLHEGMARPEATLMSVPGSTVARCVG